MYMGGVKRCGGPYADFIGECLALILTFNYCFFAGDVWQQTLGYATGVACGGECAHLYLEERLAPVFALFAADLLMHVRYALVMRFHLPDWRYGAISLDAQVGVRIDPPTLEAI